MRIGSFEFNMRELAGSLGDFGTLLPLAIGYISVCGLDPAGLLVMMGLANIATGVVYRLPMPIEPMKVLAAVAIAERWTPETVYASGFVMGIVWLVMGATGAMDYVARNTPRSVLRGIQLSLAVMLAVQGIRMASTWWLLGAASVVVIVLLRKSRYTPASIVLVAGGILIMYLQGWPEGLPGIGVSLPPIAMIDGSRLWPAFRDAGMAQIPLTATNAVIATSVLITEYWPDRRVTNRQLAVNMGVMNVIAPLAGGMPMCHGAGGLAGQYYFGARTGGANIIEGVIEILLGVLLAGSVAAVFAAFPEAIVGAMMVMVGVGMAKFARDLRPNRHLVTVIATVGASLATNMAVGFGAGLAVHAVMKRVLPPLRR
ncbi:MAG: putative sulfate/molybdate transporter [Alkalispirochaeta sp.]